MKNILIYSKFIKNILRLFAVIFFFKSLKLILILNSFQILKKKMKNILIYNKFIKNILRLFAVILFFLSLKSNYFLILNKKEKKKWI